MQPFFSPWRHRQMAAVAAVLSVRDVIARWLVISFDFWLQQNVLFKKRRQITAMFPPLALLVIPGH